MVPNIALMRSLQPADFKNNLRQQWKKIAQFLKSLEVSRSTESYGRTFKSATMHLFGPGGLVSCRV